MTAAEALSLLEESEVVPALQAGLASAKELVAACLAAQVPATLGRDDHCTKGCSPKAFLLVRRDDLPRVQALLEAQWAELLADVGDGDVVPAGVGIEAAGDAEPPCPACGHRGALEDGACRECGLQLA
jgi:hypothetical protein